MKSLEEQGTRLAVTFTILDGYVVGLSHFHHSMNYRSAILHGSISPLGSLAHEKGQEHSLKAEKFKRIIDTAFPGRWDHARQPNVEEIRKTGLIRMVVESASAKIGADPPIHKKEDLENEALRARTWTGIVPVRRQIGELFEG
jgi:uncharacterized protein